MIILALSPKSCCRLSRILHLYKSYFYANLLYCFPKKLHMNVHQNTQVGQRARQSIRNNKLAYGKWNPPQDRTIPMQKKRPKNVIFVITKGKNLIKIISLRTELKFFSLNLICHKPSRFGMSHSSKYNEYENPFVDSWTFCTLECSHL
jgi:hypothetical protein